MVAGSGRKVSATADWLAVRGVQCEPVSARRIPVEQEKYREFSGFGAIAARRG